MCAMGQDHGARYGSKETVPGFRLCSTAVCMEQPLGDICETGALKLCCGCKRQAEKDAQCSKAATKLEAGRGNPHIRLSSLVSAGVAPRNAASKRALWALRDRRRSASLSVCSQCHSDFRIKKHRRRGSKSS